MFKFCSKRMQDKWAHCEDVKMVMVMIVFESLGNPCMFVMPSFIVDHV